MESVGFKEWALVCEALGRGEQCILLRKGGIAEGRAGFGFRHTEFFLFPTYFHEQAERIRPLHAEVPAERTGKIEMKFFVTLETSVALTKWATAIALEPFHVLQPEVVWERFEYSEIPGIHVAFVRVYRLTQPWVIPKLRAYGGCRSWVNLLAIPDEAAREAVLSQAEHQARLQQFRDLIDEFVTAR